MSDANPSFGFGRIDYAVFPDTRQIQHWSGICFRFDRGETLSLLGPPPPRRDALTAAVERGARAVLAQWPKGSLAW
jgi:hypothetical protein